MADRGWAVFTVLGAIFSVQGGASIAKHLFPLIGPGGAVSLRVGLAGVLLSLINRPNYRSFTKEQWMCALFYGFSIAAMNTTFYYGVRRVPLGVGVTVEFLGPLALALVTSRKWTDFIWAGFAALGIAMIVPWTGAERADPIGVLLVALAGVLWAAYIVATKRISGRLPARDAVTVGMGFAALMVLPFGVFSGDLFNVDGKLLALGFGVAIFSSVLPFTLDLFSMRKLDEKTYSILMSLQPAVAALAGLVFLGEVLSVVQWFAIASVIIASVGATLTSHG